MAGVLVHEDLAAPALLAAERPVASACTHIIAYNASQTHVLYKTKARERRRGSQPYLYM